MGRATAGLSAHENFSLGDQHACVGEFAISLAYLIVYLASVPPGVACLGRRVAAGLLCLRSSTTW